MAKKKDEWTEATEEWQAEDNPWYQQAKQNAEALQERPAFSYDPAADPLYQSAAKQYLRQGRQAMEDSMGRAAALSGGYASTYAQSLGNRAYETQLNRLAELLPDYYEKARAVYDRETGALRDSLSTALGLYDQDYQVWLDRQSARERRAAAETKSDQWEREFAEGHSRWEAEMAQDQSHWEAEMLREAEQWAAQQAASAASQDRADAKTNRSYAYRMAMLALQQGLSVSDALLQTAGIDRAYAETIRRYYYNLHH